MKNMFLGFIEDNKLNLKDKNICIGISTGVDSSVLLDLLLKNRDKFNYNIILCHVNHKKRLQSEEEELYIKDFAKKNNLILEVLHLDLHEIEDENFQSAARMKRLSFFNDVMNKYNSEYLFLAHHLNDDIETSLMHIIRGSNLKGYSGIDEISFNKEGKYILRPLLKVLKDEIVEYAIKNGVKYFEDESNNSDDYTRNRVRHFIVPKFFEENNNFKDQFLQYKETLKQAYILICEKRDQYINELIDRKDDVLEFDVTKFKELDDFYQEQVLFEVLKKHQLSKKNIQEIIKLIDSNKANLVIDYKNISFCKQYDRVSICDKFEKVGKNTNILIDKLGVFDVNNDFELVVEEFSLEDLKKNENMLTNLNVIWYNVSNLPLILRNRQNGDRIQIGEGTKKIKDLLIDEKVPQSKRDSLLLLEKDGEILNIFGLKKSSILLKSKNNNILITLREKK